MKKISLFFAALVCSIAMSAQTANVAQNIAAAIAAFDIEDESTQFQTISAAATVTYIVEDMGAVTICVQDATGALAIQADPDGGDGAISSLTVGQQISNYTVAFLFPGSSLVYGMDIPAGVPGPGVQITPTVVSPSSIGLAHSGHYITVNGVIVSEGELSSADGAYIMATDEADNNYVIMASSWNDDYSFTPGDTIDITGFPFIMPGFGPMSDGGDDDGDFGIGGGGDSFTVQFFLTDINIRPVVSDGGDDEAVYSNLEDLIAANTYSGTVSGKLHVTGVFLNFDETAIFLQDDTRAIVAYYAGDCTASVKAGNTITGAQFVNTRNSFFFAEVPTVAAGSRLRPTDIYDLADMLDDLTDESNNWFVKIEGSLLDAYNFSNPATYQDGAYLIDDMENRQISLNNKSLNAVSASFAAADAVVVEGFLDVSEGFGYDPVVDDFVMVKNIEVKISRVVLQADYTTGVGNGASAQIAIYSENNNIVVEGAEGAKITVFNLNGQAVASVVAASSRTEIPAGGLRMAVVSVDGKTVKVALK